MKKSNMSSDKPCIVSHYLPRPMLIRSTATDPLIDGCEECNQSDQILFKKTCESLLKLIEQS